MIVLLFGYNLLLSSIKPTPRYITLYMGAKVQESARGLFPSDIFLIIQRFSFAFANTTPFAIVIWRLSRKYMIFSSYFYLLTCNEYFRKNPELLVITPLYIQTDKLMINSLPSFGSHFDYITCLIRLISEILTEITLNFQLCCQTTRK